MFYILLWIFKKKGWALWHNEKGFSLLELALALMVMGILGGMVAPFLLTQMRTQKIHQTLQNQERILHALGAYLRQNGALPCPADAALSAQWGVAPPLCVRGPAQGIVPFKTLGLAEYFAKDGQGRFFTYVVHEDLTRPVRKGHMEPTGYCMRKIVTKENIILQDPQGPLMKDLSPENVIAVLLISHGHSGEGSLQSGGHRLPFTHGNQCKKENGNGDAVFCLKSSVTDTGLFDDVVRFETRFNFAQYYGNIFCQQK